MKKTYIIPSAFSVQIETKRGLLTGSAKISFGSGNPDVTYGGESDGGMTSDTKGVSSSDQWDNEW